jgi:hypothetical protein
MVRKIFGKIQIEWGIPPDAQMRVIAWDADFESDDRMGESIVNQDGSYLIQYPDIKWDWTPSKLVSNWRPDVYVVVENYNKENETWEQIAKSKVFTDQDTREDLEINLSVDLPLTNSNSIYGKIIDTTGKPLNGLKVTAWDEKPIIPSATESVETIIQENEEFLGSATTNNEGKYKIRYDPKKFMITLNRVLDEGILAYRRPDLFIKVHEKDEESFIYRSPTHQNIICALGCRIDAKITKIFE